MPTEDNACSIGGDGTMHICQPVARFQIHAVPRLACYLCYAPVLPQVLAMIDNPHYLYRMTVLSAIAALAPVITHDVLVDSMLPVVINAGKDKVRCTASVGWHRQAQLARQASTALRSMWACALAFWTCGPVRNWAESSCLTSAFTLDTCGRPLTRCPTSASTWARCWSG
jgi:hypothetical protein